MEDAFIKLIIDSSVILLLASLGEIIKERAGILNLGLEGIISLSALTAIATYLLTGSYLIAVLASGVVGSLLSALHGLFSIYIKGDQVLSGLAILFIGLGLSGAIGTSYTGIEIDPLPTTIYILDPLSIAAYSTAILIFILTRYTRLGLILDGLGDNPEGLDYLGYDVYRLRMYTAVLGGFLVGLAGAKLTLSLIPVWTMGVSGGRGWIALALVISAIWNPLLAIPISHLFGFLTQAGILTQVFNIPIDSRLASTAPYIATITLLTTLHTRKFRKFIRYPKEIGKSYERHPH